MSSIVLLSAVFVSQIHLKLFKWFADIFLHGAKHLPAAKPPSSPKGDPGGLHCLSYVPEMLFLRDSDGEVIPDMGLDGTVRHDLFCADSVFQGEAF